MHSDCSLGRGLLSKYFHPFKNKENTKHFGKVFFNGTSFPTFPLLFQHQNSQHLNQVNLASAKVVKSLSKSLYQQYEVVRKFKHWEIKSKLLCRQEQSFMTCYWTPIELPAELNSTIFSQFNKFNCIEINFHVVVHEWHWVLDWAFRIFKKFNLTKLNASYKNRFKLFLIAIDIWILNIEKLSSSIHYRKYYQSNHEMVV